MISWPESSKWSREWNAVYRGIVGEVGLHFKRRSQLGNLKETTIVRIESRQYLIKDEDLNFLERNRTIKQWF